MVSNDENIWLDCIRSKLRFPNSKGDLTVEDLFQLGLDELDEIYTNLDSVLQSKGKSLRDKVNKADFVVQKKLKIVESVYDLKKMELDEVQREIRKNEQKSRIMELIHKKEDEELSDLTIDELKELLRDLD